MNPTDRNPNRPLGDDEALDLLVDGELDEARRRELLLRLEREPDGWRRCALAFLEAQSLSREMKSLVRRPPRKDTPKGGSQTSEVAATSEVSAGIGQTARRRWLDGRAGTVLAMAASFLIALGLGTLLRDFATRSKSNVVEPGQLVATDPGSGERGIDRTPGLPPEPEASGPWQLVNLDMHGGPEGAGGSIQLPACQRDSIDDAWLRSFPQAMPRDVQQALRRSGHRVHQSRQLMPLRMKDGRQLVVPVDQVDVHYVGNQPYQ